MPSVPAQGCCLEKANNFIFFLRDLCLHSASPNTNYAIYHCQYCKLDTLETGERTRHGKREGAVAALRLYKLAFSLPVLMVFLLYVYKFWLNICKDVFVL